MGWTDLQGWGYTGPGPQLFWHKSCYPVPRARSTCPLFARCHGVHGLDRSDGGLGGPGTGRDTRAARGERAGGYCGADEPKGGQLRGERRVVRGGGALAARNPPGRGGESDAGRDGNFGGGCGDAGCGDGSDDGGDTGRQGDGGWQRRGSGQHGGPSSCGRGRSGLGYGCEGRAAYVRSGRARVPDSGRYGCGRAVGRGRTLGRAPDAHRRGQALWGRGRRRASAEEGEHAALPDGTARAGAAPPCGHGGREDGAGVSASWPRDGGVTGGRAGLAAAGD